MDQVAPSGPGSRLVEGWNGHDYERHSFQQRAWGGDLIAELTLRGDERILDLGCGDGTLTERLAALVPRGSVLGIDAAPEMLEAAQGKCGPNMRVTALDIRQLDFTAEFDLAFSNATLHWVQEHAAVLTKIHHALRPGGIMRVQFGADGNCPTFAGCVRRQMAAAPYREAFASFSWPWFFPSLPDYEALLAASPFIEWRAWIEPKEARFPTPEALVGWTDNPALIPFVQALPPTLRQSFRDAVVADMLDRTRQPDGSHLEPFRRMNVWARRSPIR
jgi:trans-aconitate methyltransferase